MVSEILCTTDGWMDGKSDIDVGAPPKKQLKWITCSAMFSYTNYQFYCLLPIEYSHIKTNQGLTEINRAN